MNTSEPPYIPDDWKVKVKRTPRYCVKCGSELVACSGPVFYDPVNGARIEWSHGYCSRFWDRHPTGLPAIKTELSGPHLDGHTKDEPLYYVITQRTDDPANPPYPVDIEKEWEEKHSGWPGLKMSIRIICATIGLISLISAITIYILRTMFHAAH